MSESPFEIAAELARALAADSFAGGRNVYAPQWYRTNRGPRLGDDGAIDAIRSGDPQKMREALAALKEREVNERGEAHPTPPDQEPGI